MSDAASDCYDTHDRDHIYDPTKDKSKNTKITVDFKAKEKGYRAKCVSCDHVIIHGECDTPEDFSSRLDKVVCKESFCEICGCNTFNIIAFFSVEISS